MQFFGNENSAYQDNIGSYHNDSQCATPLDIYQCQVFKIGDYTMQYPTLVPCCLASLIVGVNCGIKIFKLQYRSSLFYGICLCTIGVMMTCAAFADSLLPDSKYKHSLFALVISITDVALTSSIALCLFFCALIDSNIIKINQWFTLFLYICGVITIFILWTCYFFDPYKFVGLNVFLYEGIVGFGCGTWVLVQLYLLITKVDFRGAQYLIYAALLGGLGFFAIISPKENQILCQLFSCFFSGTFVWFLVTPICAYLIFKYYAISHQGLYDTAEEKQLVQLVSVANYDNYVFNNTTSNNLNIQQNNQKPIIFYQLDQKNNQLQYKYLISNGNAMYHNLKN